LVQSKEPIKSSCRYKKNSRPDSCFCNNIFKYL